MSLEPTPRHSLPLVSLLLMDTAETGRGRLRVEEGTSVSREISQTERWLRHLWCNKYFIRGLQTVLIIQCLCSSKWLNPFIVKETESHPSPQSQELLAPWACPQTVTQLNAKERLTALKHNRHFSSECMSRCECAHCAWPTRRPPGATGERYHATSPIYCLSWERGSI